MITTNSKATYEETVKNPNTVFDAKYNIYYESQALADQYHARLGLRCPLCYKSFAAGEGKENPLFKTEKELIKHVTLKPERIMCDLCLSTLKVFPYEMLCYTRSVGTKWCVDGRNT